MKRKRLVVVLGVAVLGLAFATAGLARSTGTGSIEIGTLMDTKQEVPKANATRGAGLFTGTIKGGTLTWRMPFTKMTGAAGAAHIHLAPRGKAGDVVVPLCAPCKPGQNGTSPIKPAVVAAIKAGGAYVNVHTAKNAGGEIRGQLVVVG